MVTRETNSNYSNFLILWDRLHRTLRLKVRQEDVVVGVTDYRDPRELTVLSLLLMPFRPQRQPLPAVESGRAEGPRQTRGLEKNRLQP